MRAFDTTIDRRATRLSDDELRRCADILSRMHWLNPWEGWLLLNELRLAREELAALKAKVTP